jgi:hypothetical protein
MGKFLFAAVCALFMLLAGCSLNDYSPGPGVTITPTTLTPVTTPTATATVTVTAPPRPMWPTETFKTKNPATAQGCIDNGLNADDWDTVDDFGSGAMSDGPIFDVSASPGPCYDTIVFNVHTLGDTGFTARYVDVVSDGGQGAPIQGFKGSAYIQLTVNAPLETDESGTVVDPERYSLPDPVGFETLRELRNVPDYEGYSSFGIGVDHKVPFAVEYEIGGSSGTGKVIVYLAHE